MSPFPPHRRPHALAVVLTGVLLTAGCERKEALPVGATDLVVRLSYVCQWYNRFIAQTQRSPASPDEFRTFVRNLPDPDRHVPAAELDAYLTSPRDKEPLVIRCGIALPTGDSRNGPVVAYEHTGVGGKRFVVYLSSGRAEEVDDARFRELTGGAGVQ